MKSITLLAALALVAVVSGGTPASADGSCSGCAVQQPDTPVMPQTPEDGGGCSGCATPIPPAQKLADGGNCTGCALQR